MLTSGRSLSHARLAAAMGGGGAARGPTRGAGAGGKASRGASPKGMAMEKVIVFSQWTAMLDLAEAPLKREGCVPWSAWAGRRAVIGTGSVGAAVPSLPACLSGLGPGSRRLSCLLPWRATFSASTHASCLPHTTVTTHTALPCIALTAPWAPGHLEHMFPSPCLPPPPPKKQLSNRFAFRRLDGTMSIKLRQQAIDDFSRRPDVCVLLVSLKAASLGVNLVSANHVVLLGEPCLPGSTG